MSSLPNSKSSFFHAARNCSALVLASAMVLPMTPALAQDAAPTANAPIANAPAANTPATQDVADEPSFTVTYEDYYYQDGRDYIGKRATACTPVRTVKSRFWAPASPRSGASSTAR